MNRAFILGLVAGLGILGCLAAVTNTNGSTGARYEVHWNPAAAPNSNGHYVVLDSQTGSTVAWTGSPSGEFREFRPQQ